MKAFWCVFLGIFPGALSAQSLPGSDVSALENGQLTIEVSGPDFVVTLNAPGAEILGFDHPAQNEEERAQVAVAISELSRPQTVFAVPFDARCETTAAHVVLNGEAFGAASSAAPQHLEIRAEYHIHCDAIDALTTMQFPFFSHFPAARMLRAYLKLENGDTEVEIKRTEPVLVLN